MLMVAPPLFLQELGTVSLLWRYIHIYFFENKLKREAKPGFNQFEI